MGAGAPTKFIIFSFILSSMASSYNGVAGWGWGGGYLGSEYGMVEGEEYVLCNEGQPTKHISKTLVSEETTNLLTLLTVESGKME